MKDTLNITELIIEGELHRTIRRRRYKNIVIGLLIATVIPALLALTMPDRPGDLYIWQDNEWRIERLPHNAIPHMVQVSNTGQVWVNNWLKASIYQRDTTGKWFTHTCGDFNTECGQVYPFTTDGNEFWGVVYDSVIHYDGKNWLSYHEVLPTNYSASIAKGKDGVVVLSHDGQISMFNGSEWQIEAAVDVLPFIEETGENNWGTVVTAKDGAFWLAYHGFWRYDGEAWKLVQRATPDEAEHFRIMGLNEDTIWLNTGYELVAYNPKTRSRKQSFSGSETGQAGNVSFNVTARGDKIWLATDKGIRYYDGQDWGKMPVQPPTDEIKAYSVSLAPDGALWTTILDPIVFDLDEYSDDTNEREIIAGITALFGSFYVLIQFGTFYQPSAQWYRKATQHLLPLFPEFVQSPSDTEHNKLSNRRRWMYVFGFMLLGFTVDVIGRSLQSPLWFSFVIIMSVVTLATRHESIAQLFNRKIREEEKLDHWRTVTQTLLLVLLSVGPIVVLSWIVERLTSLPLESSPLLTCAVLLSGLGIGYGLSNQLLTLPMRYIYLTYVGKSNYEGAERVVDRLEPYLRYIMGFKGLRGLIALHKGDFAQAEAIWYSLALQNQQAAVMANLAFSYLDQNRFQEALALFSYCIELEPMKDLRYWLLMAYYIKLDQYPERALEFSDALLRFSKEPRLSYFFRRNAWITFMGARARILASVGRYNEAEALINVALQKARVRFNPTQAYLYLTMGYVKEQRGRVSEAQEYYQLALKLDPNGDEGQKARRELAKQTA